MNVMFKVINFFLRLNVKDNRSFVVLKKCLRMQILTKLLANINVMLVNKTISDNT